MKLIFIFLLVSTNCISQNERTINLSIYQNGKPVALTINDYSVQLIYNDSIIPLPIDTSRIVPVNNKFSNTTVKLPKLDLDSTSSLSFKLIGPSFDISSDISYSIDTFYFYMGSQHTYLQFFVYTNSRYLNRERKLHTKLRTPRTSNRVMRRHKTHPEPICRLPNNNSATIIVNLIQQAPENIMLHPEKCLDSQTSWKE